MQTLNHHENLSSCCAAIHESRSPHRNVAVRHPSRWRLLADFLLSSPMRLHRYRNLSVRMFEDVLSEIDHRDCR